MIDIGAAYRELAPKLVSHLTGGGVSQATACDIVQETFLRVWERREELSDDPREVSGLVFAIARNYRNDLARRAKKESIQADLTDEIDRQAAGPVGDEPRPGEEAEEIESLKRRLKASLARMPVQLLEAFTLFRIGNMAVREIAQEVAASEANVKVRVHRAKEMFREVFDVERRRDIPSRQEKDGYIHQTRRDAASTVSRYDGTFEFAVLKTLLRLSAVDGEIAKEELAAFRELTAEYRAGDQEGFDRMWSEALQGASYLGFLSELLPPEGIIGEFVHESEADFIAGARAASPEERARAFAALERMAEADGVYSQIERSCITSLSLRLRLPPTPKNFL